MQSFTESLKNLFGEIQGETQENIQTRIRGSLLMAVANKTNQLLLTTGNKPPKFLVVIVLFMGICAEP